MARTKYIYYQPNDLDLKDDRGDCAIRAFCKAFNRTWLEVFDDLCKYARNLKSLPNSKLVINNYLLDMGWGYVSIKRGQKVNVEDFIKTNKSGNYILSLRAGYGTHLVAVNDGYYYDTWDCGKKYLLGYYQKKL